MSKFLAMNKFLGWLAGVLATLLTATVIGGFVWYNDVNILNSKQDSEIKHLGIKCKELKDKAINIESMAKSNDDAIDEIKIDVAVIKTKMATKEDINTLRADIIRELRTLNAVSYEQ